MIFANGKILPTSEQNRVLNELEDRINETRAKEPLKTETVVNAIDALSRRIECGDFNDLIASLEIDNIDFYVAQAIKLLKRESIEYKLQTELGREFMNPYTTDPPFGLKKLRVCPVPLGTLFHIAAGNVDILPAFSVAEGLLTGNINILKLPQADSGLTVQIAARLAETEPALADYLYVFDTPSTDIAAMKKMADMADGIVVWGGEAAVRAVRQLASPAAKIIEWGHRLSFAYLSGNHFQESELKGLAEHIIQTRQLLCSSCQTIFLNTERIEDLHSFCRKFLPYLNRAEEKYPIREIGAVAEITLRKYNHALENALEGKSAENARQTFFGTNCSLTACEDSELELSDMYGSCLVKRLPEQKMMQTLRRKKGYLQTAGLIAKDPERARLAELLIRCGVVRVTHAGSMSDTFSGEAHDGEYPLRRYLRIANIEV